MASHTARDTPHSTLVARSAIEDGLATCLSGLRGPHAVSVVHEQWQRQHTHETLVATRHSRPPPIVLAQTDQPVTQAVRVARDAVIERGERLGAADEGQFSILHPNHGEDLAHRIARVGDEVFIAKAHVAIRRAAEQDASGEIPDVPEECALRRTDLLHMRPSSAIGQCLAA